MAKSGDPLVPHDVGRKFDANGAVRRFAGNTFIGHVAQQGEDFPTFDALLDIYREFPRHDFAAKISLTPPSSYHITVFGGLNEEDRGTPRWPAKVDKDAPLEQVNRQWLSELRARPPLNNHVFEFELGLPQLDKGGAPHIPLVPADDVTAKRLATLRNELSELTGIRDKDHDTYKHHLTFGYVHQLLSDAEAADLLEATRRWMRTLSSQARRIRVPAVQFCRFRDMYAFEVLHEL
ncbi:MAG TPA: DUF1868 domain-containing protein [Burkholderiaceae bacterium]